MDREREERFVQALIRRRYEVAVFDTGAQAAAYLDEAIDGKTVGFGDSETMLSMGLYDLLSAHNEVRDPMHRPHASTCGADLSTGSPGHPAHRRVPHFTQRHE